MLVARIMLLVTLVASSVSAAFATPPLPSASPFITQPQTISQANTGGACRAVRPYIYAPGLGRVWLRSPGVVILAATNDDRIPVTHDAIKYWNDHLKTVGGAFQLGPVSVAALRREDVDYVKRRSEAALYQQRHTSIAPPQRYRDYCGKIFIILANNQFISFSGGVRGHGMAIIGIEGGQYYPLNRPNVASDVSAHAIGNALGFGHNRNPSMLMCGHPADCRPDAFQSDTERFFPLSAGELHHLKEKYAGR
jgi:hypothetical protein